MQKPGRAPCLAHRWVASAFATTPRRSQANWVAPSSSDFMLNLLKEYVNEYGKLPTHRTVYKEQNIGIWCTDR